MSPSPAAMAGCIRCSPATSDWRKCLRAYPCGYSRSSNNRRTCMLREVTGKTAATFAAVAVLQVASITTMRAADGQNDTPQAQIDQGKATDTRNCSHCHVPNMVNSGAITPDLRAFPDDQTRFVFTVKQGKSNRMPPWGDILSDDEITDLWAYISSRRRP